MKKYMYHILYSLSVLVFGFLTHGSQSSVLTLLSGLGTCAIVLWIVFLKTDSYYEENEDRLYEMYKRDGVDDIEALIDLHLSNQNRMFLIEGFALIAASNAVLYLMHWVWL